MKYLCVLFLITLVALNRVVGQPIGQMGMQSFVHPCGITCAPPAIFPEISQKTIIDDKAGIPPRLRVAYIIPSNRTGQPNAVADMQYLVMLAQSWYREQMKLNGFGEKTFLYETVPNSNKPLVNIVNTSFTDDYIRADPWGRTIAAAQNGGLSVLATNEVWFLISETHVMSANGSLIGGIALGGGGAGTSGGVALVGSDWLALFGKLTDNTSFDGQVLPALGPYAMVENVTYPAFPDGTTFSSAASSFIGGAMHELGHAFGLPHDQRNDMNRFGNVMYNGFRGIRGSIYPALYPTEHMRLEFGAALYLNYSHKFNRNQRATAAPTVSVATTSPASLTNGQLLVSFTATDSDTLALAWLVYDGNRVAEMPLSATNITTQFTTPYYELGQNKEYRVVVVDKQGNVGEVVRILTVQGTGNQAPRPHIFVEEPSPRAGQSVAFKATNSSDGNDPASSLSVQWDLNNDGIYDTNWFQASNSFIANYSVAGNYLLKAKVKDLNGAESVSAPISIRVSNTSGVCRYLIPPLISGNTTTCVNTSTTLTARGCPGTVIWTDGPAGASRIVRPDITTTYMARCQLPDDCPSLPSLHYVETVPLATINSGSWNDPAIWSCGRIPTYTDDTKINTGHVVTLDGLGYASRLTIGGKLISGVSGQLRLAFVPPAALSLSGNLNFGQVTVGQTASRTLVIQNLGGPLSINGLTLPSGFSGTFSGSLATGSMQAVTITFAPSTTGVFNGLLTVNSTPSATDNTISLTATATTNTLNSALVMHLPFSGNTNDASGNNNHGIVTGPTLTIDRFGQANQAYLFNRLGGQYIRVPNSAGLDITGTAITLCAWIKPDWGAQVGTNMQIMSKAQNAGSRKFGVGTGGPTLLNVELRTNTGTTDQDWNCANCTLQQNVWQFVTIVYNGASIKWYKNGVLLHQVAKTGNIVSTTSDLIIGSFSDRAQSYFNGSMDEIRIYNRALTDAEVQALSQL